MRLQLKIIIKCSVLIFLIFCKDKTALSNESYLSLQQAIQNTLNYNLELKKAQNQIEIFEIKSKLNNTIFTPKVDINSSLSSSINYNSQKLSSGDIYSGKGVNSTNNNLGALFSWQFFNGFSAIEQHKSSKINISQSILDKEITKRELIKGVCQAYFNLAKIKKIIYGYEKIIRVINQNIKILEEQKKQGRIDADDLYEMIILKTNYTNDFLSANNISNNLNIELNRIMGQELSNKYLINDSVFLNVFFEKKIIKPSLEMQKQELQTKISESNIRQSRSIFYPRISTSILSNYTIQNTPNSFFIKTENKDIAFQISANWTLLSFGKNKNQLKINKKINDIEKINYEIEKSKNDADYIKLINDYQTNIKVRENEKKIINFLSEKIVRYNQKLELGSISTLEYNLMLQELLKAIIKNADTESQIREKQIEILINTNNYNDLIVYN